MKTALLLALVLLHANQARAVDFKSQVAPLLKQYCYKCHSDDMASHARRIVHVKDGRILSDETHEQVRVRPAGGSR